MIFACFSTLPLVLWWNPTRNSHGPAWCTVFQQLRMQQALSEYRKSYTITTKSSCRVQNCIHDGRFGRERTRNMMLFIEWRKLHINGTSYVLSGKLFYSNASVKKHTIWILYTDNTDHGEYSCNCKRTACT